MDWITLLITLTGVVLAVLWTIVPINEFRHILRAVKQKAVAADEVAPPREVRGFEVHAPDEKGGPTP